MYVITGANSGLGHYTSKWLMARGADVVFVCRSAERGQQAIDDANTVALSGGAQQHGRGTLVVGDVSIAGDCDRIVDAIRAFSNGKSGIDGVLLNAGALASERVVTPDGLEVTAACHVINGVWRLGTLLRPLCSADGRVVVVTSGGGYLATNDDFVSSGATEIAGTQQNPARNPRLCGSPPPKFDGIKAYSQAKRAQMSLVATWPIGGAPVVATHPGWASTPGVTRSIPDFENRIGDEMRTTAQGAAGLIWSLVTPVSALSHGKMYLDGTLVPMYGAFAFAPKSSPSTPDSAVMRAVESCGKAVMAF